MRIGIMGTGMVGQTIGSRLIELGHEVRLGSRSATNAKAGDWVQKNAPRASQGTFADAAQFGEMIFNCTQGGASLDALTAAGAVNLSGKVLVDVANPLNLEKDGTGATLLFCDSDSLGERIQAAFPRTNVVKTLNTMWCGLMVNPRLIGEGHTVFISGNDRAAKAQVADLLMVFGWQQGEIVDLGDIRAARGTEMLLPLWLRIWQTSGTSTFNVKIVSAAHAGGASKQL
jgi:predicted dinucleotide-binding enzyme